jgi:hypothetical protein
VPWFSRVADTLRAHGRSASLQAWLTRVSTFETLTFSWEPPRAPGSRSILRAEQRSKKYFKDAFAQALSLPSGLLWLTG